MELRQMLRIRLGKTLFYNFQQLRRRLSQVLLRQLVAAAN